MNLPVQFLSEHATLPNRAHEGDACIDLYAAHDEKLVMHSVVKVKTNVAIQLPKGTAGLLWDRSGLASKGIIVLGGMMDEPYRGEYIVLLSKVAYTYNDDSETYYIKKGDRICQLLIIKYEFVIPIKQESLDETIRGDRGFGSTGR